ncbi:MAG: hypothetical protein DMG07_23825 [Acidobacteria bacterium]|nr:MAG: hypothetical protein DMG07_23825 [Acidobacteriota bacterium]
MVFANQASLLCQLLDLKGRLRSAVSSDGPSEDLRRLLQEVDLALGRLTEGTHGLCEMCADPIELNRPEAEPLIRTCLAQLSLCEQRMLEHDLDLAHQVQKSLLPANDLQVDGWETAYHYAAAGPVSGDYCDLIKPEQDRERFYFFLGDVSGKGIAASILMSHLQGIFRTVRRAQARVSLLVERANRLLFEGSPSMCFATLVGGRADRSGEVEICNAGHCQPLIVRKGNVEMVPVTDRPIGLFCDVRFRTHKLKLESGDILVCYSDGWTEARNKQDGLYGPQRLVKLVKRHERLSAADLTRVCLEDLKRFSSGAPMADDVTLLVLKKN